MPLRTDCAGLESLPMRLMVVAVVVSLSVVPAARALDSFERREFLVRAAAEVERILAVAQVLTVEGPGSARTLVCDLSGGGPVEFESITLGDRIGGPNMSCAVLRLSTGAAIVRTAHEPAIILTGPGMRPLTVTDPRFELRLSGNLEGMDVVILAEVM